MRGGVEARCVCGGCLSESLSVWAWCGCCEVSGLNPGGGWNAKVGMVVAVRGFVHVYMCVMHVYMCVIHVYMCTCVHV